MQSFASAGIVVLEKKLFFYIGQSETRMPSFLVVDRGFEPWYDETKDYEIGICCFPTNHAALRSKSKDWLAPNQDNVTKWSCMSNHGLLILSVS
jgi:hypothetical protein